MGDVALEQGERGEDEADEEAAAVAEEDRGRVPVVDEEAEQAPDEGDETRLMKNSPRSQAFSSRTSEATKATPAESPSMLSSRLKALVMPTTQTRVKATLSQS